MRVPPFAVCLIAGCLFPLVINAQVPVPPEPAAAVNDVDQLAVDSRAVRAIELLHKADIPGFRQLVLSDPGISNLRGADGSTPFMYAAVYTNAEMLAWLLERGADPNRRNDANVSALMWAVDDLEMTRTLLDAGADVNARSDDGRTALFIAASQTGAVHTVRLLLDRGADPNPPNRGPTDSTPLRQAATAGDAEVMQLLIERGANVRAGGPQLLVQSLLTSCDRCFQLAIDFNGFGQRDYNAALLEVAVFGKVSAITALLEHGARVNAKDSQGRTPLMFAASSDKLPIDAVRLLIDRGADVDAKAIDGRTALDFARRHGRTPVVSLLVGERAKETPAEAGPAPPLVPTNTPRAAVERSLSLLQKPDLSLIGKTGCSSCHNDSLTAMAVGAARRSGFAVDETVSAHRTTDTLAIASPSRGRALQGHAQNVSVGTAGSILLGLHAEDHKPDLLTDAMARHIKVRQMPDGRWAAGPACAQPPLCGSEISQTVLALRALQLYAPALLKSAYEESADRARQWLLRARATTSEERAFRLMGLVWTGVSKYGLVIPKKELLAAQRDDGGWSDIPSLESSPYATGLVLSALREAGVSPLEPPYQQGVQFLLRTQHVDGSWHVKSRAIPIHPYFDNGLPHGRDQSISSAATTWATMALAPAARTGTA